MFIGAALLFSRLPRGPSPDLSLCVTYSATDAIHEPSRVSISCVHVWRRGAATRAFFIQQYVDQDYFRQLAIMQAIDTTPEELVAM